MGVEDPSLEIPALRENPFHARPLEIGKSNLLVGRDNIAGTWTRFLKQRNPRMVLLIGENGSGRTSLIRCVAEEAGKYVHLDMFPSANRSKSILDEIYGSLIGFEVPSSSQELVSRLVQYTEDSEGPMPLISLDYTSADGKTLSDTIAVLLASLERLRALVVVTLTTDQRAQWPENLVQRFDHNEVLRPLSADEVSELCQKRVAAVARTGWKLPEDALDNLMEKSSGIPTRVMRAMRDMVDYERSNPREVKYDSEIEESVEEELLDTENSENDDLDTQEQEEESGFDLDLDALEKEESITIPTAVSNPPPLPMAGAFGRIAARNRNFIIENQRYNKETAPEYTPEPESLPQNQLWMEEGSEPAVLQELVSEEPMLVDDTRHISNTGPYVAPEETNEGLLSQLFDALKLPNGMGLADLLAAMRRPIIGQRESNPLDISTLRNLSRNEAMLVEIGSERKFSPSDTRLLDRLNIKRPRLSQMCNRLYRAGIMSVQQKGKSRMFGLTNDARAQLVAWGMMEGSQ